MKTKPFGTKMFSDRGFSIRTGTWGYYITHDSCFSDYDGNSKEAASYALTKNEGGYHSAEGYTGCTVCSKIHPKEMEGLIDIMMWEK